MEADASPLPAPDSGDTPLTALERSIREALQRPPCIVMFSGGRDSSAILAMAANIAVRHGLPLPIALTLRFPGADRTEESAWQEMVLGHVGGVDWLRRDVTDELDWLGPYARDMLLRHGLVWPPNTHFLALALEAVGEGTVLAGAFGDELFRQEPRMARVRAVLARRVRPTVRDIPRVGFAFAPRLVKGAVLHRRGDDEEPIPDWVRPEVRTEASRLIRRDLVGPSVFWNRDFRWWWSRRYPSLVRSAAAVVASRRPVRIVYPFGDPRFVTALAEYGGRWGFAGRGEAMSDLFGHLLPEAIVHRRTKADFHQAFWNDQSARFARSWQGRGVSSALVDSERLQAHWVANARGKTAQTRYAYQSALLLQAAWLAGEGAPTRVAR